MKETKIYEFDPVIYPYKFWIVIDKTPNIISEKFNGYDNKAIENIDKDTSGLAAFTMPVTRKENPYFGVIIFFRSKKSISYELVAHECSHAAKYLFEHIGADIKEHEPFEYVVGWMADCCGKIKTGKFKY